MRTFTLRVPPSVDQVLQLDSPPHVRGYGLDPDNLRHLKRGAVEITATLDQLEHFATFLEYDAIPDGLEGPPRRAAAKSGIQIKKFVRKMREAAGALSTTKGF